MQRQDFKIEICANSLLSAMIAAQSGADRVELCAGMPEGGTTPSWGEIACVREMAPIRLHVIIRPRGGDFLYSAEERKVIWRDIEAAQKLGADGVVLGCLTPDGEVDVASMKELMRAAEGMSVTFHRAFDMCRHPLEALRRIEELGCHRILTSGQEASAEAGIPLIRQLVAEAQQVIIMPGCGVNASNIKNIAEQTGAREFHLSARKTIESGMIYRNSRVSMGGTVHVAEYGQDVSSEEKIRQVIQVLEENLEA